MLTELGLYKLFGEDPEKAQRFARWIMTPVTDALAPTGGYGADRVPDSGGLVVASNHLSAIDPVIVPMFCPRTVYPMAKIELLEVPVAGEALRWLGSFAVRRGEGDRDAIRVARWIVAEGHAVGFFSEGTRQTLGYPGASHAGRRDDRDPGERPARAVRARHVPVVASESPQVRHRLGRADRPLGPAAERQGLQGGGGRG